METVFWHARDIKNGKRSTGQSYRINTRKPWRVGNRRTTPPPPTTSRVEHGTPQVHKILVPNGEVDMKKKNGGWRSGSDAGSARCQPRRYLSAVNEKKRGRRRPKESDCRDPQKRQRKASDKLLERRRDVVSVENEDYEVGCAMNQPGEPGEEGR